MEMKAAVLYEANKPLAIETVELDDPKDGEVLVRIAAAGVCYSDYHVMKGEWSMPKPVVLGHEGAGIVEKVGAGVTRLSPGDHVILNFRANCGHCDHCIVGRPVLCDGIEAGRVFMFDGTVRLHRNGQDIHHMTRTACFAEYAVVPESGAVPIRSDMPLDKACLIGCSVMTGLGAVTNTARIEAGSDVAVIGCGGVGLNTIQGALLAGADRIIAVDLLDNKLEYAKEFGATDLINAGNGDAVARVRELTKGGVDYAFEVIGNPKTIIQAYEMCRIGGTTVIVGMAPENDIIEINALSLPRTERAIVGSWYGSARPWVDLPKLTDLYMRGRLKIDPMISRTWRLDEINEAYQTLAAGDVARSVILFD
ncbi:Zn-dependent alcohol dehydrogenase [Thioalkalivibrio sp. HK1]|uniref:Zn-dependent alcohol dehydrogenase n=1 Tax=Thioalkalivibrio sp. HK1 TaxID=1469245 RepID=UPI0004B0B5DC|nr:Zn-dependent alcohol dehydrogenase [Thioalkalivibrio sp. HK1]